MKTKIALLFLLIVSVTGAAANEDTSIMPDNISSSISTSLTEQSTEEETNSPSFAPIFTVVGLLAAAYLILRQRDN